MDVRAAVPGLACNRRNTDFRKYGHDIAAGGVCGPSICRLTAMSKAERTSLALLVEGSQGEAMVKMEDGDVFFVAMTDAARACQAVDKFKDFHTQFKTLLATLQQWIEANRAKIRSAHITNRERDMLFLVMQQNAEFDPALADSLSELDLAVANSASLSLIDMDVMSIPPVSADSAKAFLASGEVITYAK